MKIVFTVGSTPNTLADLTSSPKLSGQIEQMPMTGLVDVVPLDGAALPAIFPRGNISGQFVFSVFASYSASVNPYDAWATAIKASAALLNQQGTLVVTPNQLVSTVTIALTNAALRSFQPLDWGGVGGRLRYTFDFAGIS